MKQNSEHILSNVKRNEKHVFWWFSTGRVHMTLSMGTVRWVQWVRYGGYGTVGTVGTVQWVQWVRYGGYGGCVPAPYHRTHRTVPTVPTVPYLPYPPYRTHRTHRTVPTVPTVPYHRTQRTAPFTVPSFLRTVPPHRALLLKFDKTYMKRHSDLPQKNMFFVGVLNWGPKKWKTACGAKFQLIYIYI